MKMNQVMTQITQGTWESRLKQSTERIQRGKRLYIEDHPESRSSVECLTKRITSPAPRMCQRAASKETVDTAQALISEVDNSNSIIHLNVRATYILGIVSTIFLICIILFLLCMCCGKKCKKLRLWCCNGCTSAHSGQSVETGELQTSTPWGGWHNPSLRPSTQLQAWQAARQAARQHCTSLQGPSALASSSAPDPTWASGGVYPSVPHCPAPPTNSPNSSSEDI